MWDGGKHRWGGGGLKPGETLFNSIALVSGEGESQTPHLGCCPRSFREDCRKRLSVTGKPLQVPELGKPGVMAKVSAAAQGRIRVNRVCTRANLASPETV